MHARTADAKRAVVLVLRAADSPHVKGLRDGAQLYRRLTEASQDVKGVRQLCRALALAHNLGATEAGRAQAVDLFTEYLCPLLPADMTALPVLAGLKARDPKESIASQFRNLYVGMSRPTSFLCLAVNEARVSADCRAALQANGWVVDALA